MCGVGGVKTVFIETYLDVRGEKEMKYISLKGEHGLDVGTWKNS